MSCPANLDTLLVVWAKWQRVPQGPAANWVSVARVKQSERRVSRLSILSLAKEKKEDFFYYSLSVKLMRWQTACGEN